MVRIEEMGERHMALIVNILSTISEIANGTKSSGKSF